MFPNSVFFPSMAKIYRHHHHQIPPRIIVIISSPSSTSPPSLHFHQIHHLTAAGSITSKQGHIGCQTIAH
jgi:hypothetical protein